MRRGVLQPVALVAVCAIAALPACGFPSVTYDTTPVDGAADGQVQKDGAGSDSTSPVDGQVEGDGALDAPVGDGASAVDAVDETFADAPVDSPGNPPDAGHEAGNPCDEDGDGFKAIGACGGNDCCDNDKKAYPGQTMWFDSPNGCGTFDYACLTKIAEEWAVGFTCTGTGATGCNGGPGFLTDPGCGGTGAFYSCQPNGLLTCKSEASGNNSPQGCH